MSSFKLDITKDLKDAENLVRGLGPKQIARPASKALNRAITTVRTKSAPIIHDQIGAETGLTKAGVKRSMRLTKAKIRELVAAITVTGKPLGLIHFSARSAAAGVRHKAWGKKQLARGAFIAQGVTTKGEKDVRTGRQVFIRTKQPKRLMKRGRYAGTGIKREPIRKLWGPSLPSTLLKKDAVRVMNKIGHDVWPKYFEHELHYYLTRKVKGR